MWQLLVQILLDLRRLPAVRRRELGIRLQQDARSWGAALYEAPVACALTRAVEPILAVRMQLRAKGASPGATPPSPHAARVGARGAWAVHARAVRAVGRGRRPLVHAVHARKACPVPRGGIYAGRGGKAAHAAFAADLHQEVGRTLVVHLPMGPDAEGPGPFSEFERRRRSAIEDGAGRPAAGSLLKLLVAVERMRAHDTTGLFNEQQSSATLRRAGCDCAEVTLIDKQLAGHPPQRERRAVAARWFLFRDLRNQGPTPHTSSSRGFAAHLAACVVLPVTFVSACLCFHVHGERERESARRASLCFSCPRGADGPKTAIAAGQYADRTPARA